MRRYLCYFATMLLVLAVTDMCLGGSVLRLGLPPATGITARISGLTEEPQDLQEQKDSAEEKQKELGIMIASESCDFVRAAFSRDKAAIDSMLSVETEYIVTEDKSSYIRYTSEGMNVEGYMATDKNLVQVRQNWYVAEDDGTVTSGVEVMIEGEKTSQIWYIHYRKVLGQWRIFMLENGI